MNAMPARAEEASETGMFTLRGAQAAEKRIRRDLLQIVREVSGALGARLRLAALAGGYARGEGAIELHGHEARPHNDYDIIAVVQRSERNDAVRARRAGLLAGNRVGVDVDVAVIEERTFLTPPATLFWLDATHGGLRWLSGDATLLDRQQRVAPHRVPPSEAGRLLGNRALGLALSRLGGEWGHEKVVLRHGHKAVAAAGDALLLSVNRYAFSLRERAASLGQLRGVPQVGSWLVEAYREALRFREDTAGWQPASGSVGEWLDEVCRQVGAVHLALESWRVGAPTTPLGFARWSGELFEQKPDARLGNVTAGLRAWIKGDAPVWPPVGHPRERLARAAVAVAYGGEEGRAEALRLLGVNPRGGNEALRLALLRLRAVGS